MADALPPNDQETPGNEPSPAEYGPDQLRNQEDRAVGQPASPNSSSTAPGKINYSGQPQAGAGGPTDSATAPGQVGYNSSGDVPPAEQNFFNSSQTTSGRFRFGNLLGTRRRKAAAGGLVTATVAGVVFLLSIFSGPFQIIHIGQLLTRSHFSHQDNAGADRIGRMFRYLKTGDSGETRLTYLESKYKDRIVGQMKAIGLDPIFDPVTGYFKSFTIDANNPQSPYHGMAPEEIKTALNEKLGVNVSVDQLNGLGSGKYRIQADGFFSAAKTNGLLAKETGNSTLVTAVRRRILAKYGFATWHPLKVLDRKANQKLADLYKSWSKAREARLKGSTAADTIDATGAGERDASGKIIPQEGGKTTLSLDKAKSILTDIKGSNSLKVTGGLAAGVGLVCAVNTTRQHIGDIRYAQVIFPLTAMAMDAITVAAQVQSGQDVDLASLGFVAKSFNGPSTVDTSAQSTSWSDAQTFRALNGESGGVAMDQGAKENISGGIPSWINWTDTGSVQTLCSGVGQAVSGVVSFLVGVFSGETVSTVAQVAAGAIVGPEVIGKLSNLVAGQAVNVAAVGADWGNDINYGAQLAGNATSLTFGGTALSSAQVAELNAQEQSQSQAEFNSQNLASRLFNPYDSRSALSKLIDNTSTSFTTNLGKMASAIFNVRHLFSSIGSLFSSHASAAPLPYDYGFPEYGFSEADLNNPAVANPYSNAEDVAKLMDNPASNAKYSQKVKDCFGMVISKVANDNDGVARWDVIPSDIPANSNDPAYGDKHCDDPSDPNWLKIRFFIMDTSVMEGYTCYQGDDTSCANDNFGGSATATATPIGDAKQLAQDILNNKNIDTGFSATVGQDLQAAANGQPGTAGAMTSAAILQLIQTVGQSHKVSVTAIQSGGQGHCSGKPKASCPSDPHYNGDAVDFGSLDGLALSGRDTGSTAIIGIAESILPKGSRFGQKGCSSTAILNLPSGFSEISDTCDHLHVDVPLGTP